MINLRRGELCSPAKSNSYLYFGRTQFAPTGFKLKFELFAKPQFTDFFVLKLRFEKIKKETNASAFVSVGYLRVQILIYRYD